jgi:DNA polymerase
MIWGEGNSEAPIMIILDNPGAREDKEGSPYVCGTRQTLQEAANHAGLVPEDLFVTYILKRRPVRAYDKEKTREICIGHLKEQLESKKPSLILCLGNVALQSFLEYPLAEVKNMRGRWTEVHDIPLTVGYHPLAVRRRPNLWPSFLEDWKLLANRYKES